MNPRSHRGISATMADSKLQDPDKARIEEKQRQLVKKVAWYMQKYTVDSKQPLKPHAVLVDYANRDHVYVRSAYAVDNAERHHKAGLRTVD